MSVGVLIPAIDQLIEKYAVYDAAPYYFWTCQDSAQLSL